MLLQRSSTWLVTKKSFELGYVIAERVPVTVLSMDLFLLDDLLLLRFHLFKTVKIIVTVRCYKHVFSLFYLSTNLDKFHCHRTCVVSIRSALTMYFPVCAAEEDAASRG